MNTKSERREDKRNKARHGMKVSGRSVFLIQRNEAKRAERILNRKAR